MTKKLPHYRFQGYTDAWELRKLGEVSSHRGGTAIENYFSEDGKYKVISIGSYGLDNKYVDQNIRAVENEVTRLRVVNKNELTMVLNDKTANGNIIGRCLLIETDDEFVINQRTEIINFDNEVNPKFAYVVLNGVFREQVKKIVQGGTQIYVNYSSVEQLSFSLPTLPEQKAIGTFFSTLDRQITLHQRKLDTLKEQKKTYLKLLFPAKGQTKPVLRFQGFEDDWEEVKLGEVAEKFDNLRVPITASKRISGNTPYYGANGIQDYVEGYTHEGEFILIAEDGANDLKDYPVQYVNGKVWVNNHAHVIQSVRNLASNLFLLRAIKTIDIEMYLVGGGRAKLNGDVMMKLPFKLPSLPEQEAIGTFFQTLDQEIAQVEDKLASLKEMKKTLLRKLFV
ncbi:restriction endonuclease subunit S [Streptococcus suis]|uniref:restriction endonuclease subunit S n=1 Tax=Streptococcus suis TaxID=1307 RepID=UPI00237CCD71|nr:restriction endonuclease subunit S [Streptococcus suis]MDE1692360.1 restriction endonuclease subunit S [Streptococcus suis]